MMNWAKQQLANVAGTQEPIYGPDAIQSVAKQAESTPYTELKKEDMKWTAMDSTSVETQSFYLMAESGHFALVQVLYSNVAGIRTTSQFNTKIFYPDGKTPHLWSSKPLENYGFDEPMLSFYADNVAVILSDDDSSYTIKSAIDENCIVNLKVTRTAPGFHVGKDGKSYYGTDPSNPWGLMRHAFWARNDVSGNIITKSGELDFKGNGFLSFALQGMKPHHAAARWNFVDFQSPRYCATMMDYTTPPSYGSTVVNVGGLVRDGEVVCAGSSNSATHTESKDDPETDWPEPRAVRFQWKGTTKDGKSVSAHLEGSLKPRLDRIDVMVEVPKFVKSIVGGVAGTKPYIYQYAQPFTLHIKIGDEESEEQGTLFYEATFIS